MSVVAAALAALGGLAAALATRKKGSSNVTEIPLSTIEEKRRAAWALATYAVDGERGRPAHGDPVYTRITLGLQDDAARQGWFFSSCAFLPHWLFEALGIDRPYVGRSREPDEPLSRLAWGEDSEPVTPATRFLTGDVIQIGSNGDSHVLVVLDYEPPSERNQGQGHLVSADYGQPGGKIRHRHVHVDQGMLIITDEARTRPARRYVSLERAAAASTPVEALVISDPAILEHYRSAPDLPGVAPLSGAPPRVAARASARAPSAAGVIVALGVAALSALAITKGIS